MKITHSTCLLLWKEKLDYLFLVGLILLWCRLDIYQIYTLVILKKIWTYINQLKYKLNINKNKMFQYIKWLLVREDRDNGQSMICGSVTRCPWWWSEPESLQLFSSENTFAPLLMTSSSPSMLWFWQHPQIGLFWDFSIFCCLLCIIIMQMVDSAATQSCVGSTLSCTPALRGQCP